MSTVSRAPGWPPSPSPRRRRGGLIAGITLGVVGLVAATVTATWLVMRPSAAPAGPPAAAPAAAPPTKAHGDLILERGEFTWQSTADPTCYGMGGYVDIRGGTTVTVTDAAGKVVALGALDPGVTLVGADGLGERCTLEFTVTGVPSGVGPYGVEVSHRGATNYAEGDLGSIEFSFH